MTRCQQSKEIPNIKNPTPTRSTPGGSADFVSCKFQFQTHLSANISRFKIIPPPAREHLKDMEAAIKKASEEGRVVGNTVVLTLKNKIDACDRSEAIQIPKCRHMPKKDLWWNCDQLVVHLGWELDPEIQLVLVERAAVEACLDSLNEQWIDIIRFWSKKNQIMLMDGDAEDEEDDCIEPGDAVDEIVFEHKDPKMRCVPLEAATEQDLKNDLQRVGGDLFQIAGDTFLHAALNDHILGKMRMGEQGKADVLAAAECFVKINAKAVEDDLVSPCNPHFKKRRPNLATSSVQYDSIVR